MQELEQELRAREIQKEGSYDKRTEHLNDDGSTIFINRLVREDSPYLLQHAHNPVNWYPWGAEAFQVAKQENKPIFCQLAIRLVIGVMLWRLKVSIMSKLQGF